MNVDMNTYLEVVVQRDKNYEALVSAVNHVVLLRTALERISKIENKTSGSFWEEIEQAREIANKALEEYNNSI